MKNTIIGYKVVYDRGGGRISSEGYPYSLKNVKDSTGSLFGLSPVRDEAKVNDYIKQIETLELGKSITFGRGCRYVQGKPVEETVTLTAVAIKTK